MVFTQIINIYKQIIPQFGDFIGQMQPRDRQSLEAHYSL